MGGSPSFFFSKIPLNLPLRKGEDRGNGESERGEASLIKQLPLPLVKEGGQGDGFLRALALSFPELAVQLQK